jgi:chemotaxis protein histidine kinase CheA
MQDSLLEAGPFSGATIGDGGEVSLILDLLKVLKKE